MVKFAGCVALASLLFLLAPVSNTQNQIAAKRYLWLPTPDDCQTETVEKRIPPPPGYSRLPVSPGSFGAWLRGLPLKSGRPKVRLYDGRLKGNQSAHFAVLDIDVGQRDLQQCADAVIRLRSEFLFSAGCEEDIAFRFTSGDVAPWTMWKEGVRPVVSRTNVQWRNSGRPDASYSSFRRYLDALFSYASTVSLARDLVKVSDPSKPYPGDVYVQAGSPGHAVLVTDVCVNGNGDRVFLLIQSYMPAQDIQVLLNPASAGSPWFTSRSSGKLYTPEWTFDYGNLRRFPVSRCADQ